MSEKKHSLDQLRIDRSTPRRSSVPIVFILLLIAGAAGGGAWWWANQPKAIAVKTHVVSETTTGGESGNTLLNSSGYVTARREATVSSKVSGKVMEVLVEEGMSVEEGQVLARIDASNTEQNLRLAEAQAASVRKALAETRVNIAQAERDLGRFVRLVAEGIGNQADTDRAQSQAEALKAQLERQTADVAVAERQIAVWKQEIEDTIITAPFAGVVTTKNAQPGEMISSMSAGEFTRTGICTIVDMTSLEIEVDVSESYINRVSAGQPVEATLDSYPEWKIPAKVIAIIPTADRQKATVKVRVAFDELDSRILPEMSVKVAFQSTDEAKPVEKFTAIPEAAVRQRDGRDIVWVVSEGKVKPRPVTIGDKVGGQARVQAGVSGGERIVIEGFDYLAEGASVTEATG
jgi:HlyD family secretion protein